jgi:cytochrome c oxidase subunit 2
MRAAAIVGVLSLLLFPCTPSAAAARRDITITKSKIVRAQPQDAPKVIRVSAERFAFFPSEITVEKGTVIEFHLTSEDTDHGFRILGTEVDVQIPKRRRGETVVKYTADTAGRFIIECSRPCGAGHTAMRATLVVK